MKSLNNKELLSELNNVQQKEQEFIGVINKKTEEINKIEKERQKNLLNYLDLLKEYKRRGLLKDEEVKDLDEIYEKIKSNILTR